MEREFRRNFLPARNTILVAPRGIAHSGMIVRAEGSSIDAHRCSLHDDPSLLRSPFLSIQN